MIDLSRHGSRLTQHEKLHRGLWTFVVEPLFRFLPKSFSGLRITALRLFGARIGTHCLIMPGVRVLKPSNLVLADYVAIGRDVDLYNFSPISIGRMTVVSQRCYLCTGTHDYMQPNMPLVHAPITIGNEVWVAACTMVLPGVEIPDGAVVGAASVVVKSLRHRDWVYAGHPCRPIKPRYPNTNDKRPGAQP